MATTSQNIFLTKKEKLKCCTCGRSVPKGHPYVAETENHKGTCFYCSPFTNYTLLAPGNAAMTRRSKKHSTLCAVLWEWNARRKRFQRKGQFVEDQAIEKARIECEQDQAIRAEKNKKAAIVREQKDKEYIVLFAHAIRYRYPYCPEKREFEIALHACEKYSGRVGRTANAKDFDPKMIDLAVEAHIRHLETNYDDQFGKGKRKKEIRSEVKGDILRVLKQWRGL
ncbi:DUF2293 domain-containing protein [Aquimarina rhabdastrellae]